jgi:hypothetical protein
MPISISTASSEKLEASSFTSPTRLKIALQAIGGNRSISDIAGKHGTSRKYVYQQRELALKGIAQVFEEHDSNTDESVLFHIPVTKKWLKQVQLALIFICRSSYGGVVEFFRDIFDEKICKSTVHNNLYALLGRVKNINQEQDLSRVKEGLHDEIYQAGRPAHVGYCARSTYCYLLKSEDTCDANSWGVHLLDLKDRQNLIPDFTVLDGGSAARAGQSMAWSSCKW